MATVETLGPNEAGPDSIDWILVETRNGEHRIYNYARDYTLLSGYSGQFATLNDAICEAVTMADHTGVATVFVRAD